MEADGIYLFGHHADSLPFVTVDRVAGGTMVLERVDVAVEDDQGFFQPSPRGYRTSDGTLDLQPGQRARVSLYWRALAAPEAERTVSVRIADSSGALIAQHDGLPGNGTKPTSWWQEGWEIRDVHYVQVSPDAQPGPGSVQVVVYDSHSLEIVPFATPGGEPVDHLRLLDVLVGPVESPVGQDGE
jgi:hypothetical protein